MEAIVIFCLVAFALIILKIITSSLSEKRKVSSSNTYSYAARDSVMTRSESDFFIKLDSVVKDRYYVFPQIHLSVLFDHRVKGQEWRSARNHINRKSVDYLLCDRMTLRPVYAIELDDYTHGRADRRERDIEVERIFKEANLPLVRFTNKDVSDDEIIQALSSANGLVNSN